MPVESITAPLLTPEQIDGIIPPAETLKSLKKRFPFGWVGLPGLTQYETIIFLADKLKWPLN